jgi:peptidoglycan/LPS O-acetylase OafA/YrhL
LSSITKSTTKELVNLDFIRAIAIGMVLISHLPISSDFIPEHYDLTSLGSLGVFIFFLHTTCVLMLSLDRQKIESTKKIVMHFFIRRIMRIYPLSIVAVLSMSCIAILGGGIFDFRVVTANLLLIQNITDSPSIPATLWSLPYEVQMYLILPFFFLMLNKMQERKIFVVFAIWILAVLIIYVGALRGYDIDLIKFFPLFISGAITFILYKLNIQKLNPSYLIVYCVALFLLFPVAVSFGIISLVLGWPAILLLGLILAFSVEIKFALLAKLSKIIAQYSYAIYLVHFPLIDLIFRQADLQFELLRWAAFFVLLSLFSYLLHQWVELPCIRIGKKWTAR